MRQLPTSARCLNPECSQLCIYRPELPGRQPLYCSDTCRAVASRDRRGLKRELAKATLELTTATGTRAVNLRGRIAHLSWVLRRYDTPPVYQGDGSRAGRS